MKHLSEPVMRQSQSETRDTNTGITIYIYYIYFSVKTELSVTSWDTLLLIY